METVCCITQKRQHFKQFLFTDMALPYKKLVIHSIHQIIVHSTEGE